MNKEELKSFAAFILTKLQPHGPITARAMFGGYGIYFETFMFACIVEGKLYFKVDDVNRKDYESFDSTPFIYEGNRKPIVMPYLTLPEAILENPKKLPSWIQKSLQASMRHKLKSKKRTRSRHLQRD